MATQKEARLREFAELLSARIDAVQKESREVFCAKQSFQSFADTLPCAAWTATTTGEIDFFNKRWYEFFGGSGVEWRPMLHPDDLEETIRAWSHAVATETPLHRTARCRDANGTYHYIVSRAHPVRNEAGRILYWVGTSSVIVEGHAALHLAVA